MTDTATLRAWLKAHASDTAELTLRRRQVKELVDELQRLQQSNDRLRKQNRKVRTKVSRLKGGEDPELVEGDPVEGDPADGDPSGGDTSGGAGVD